MHPALSAMNAATLVAERHREAEHAARTVVRDQGDWPVTEVYLSDVSDSPGRRRVRRRR